MSFFIFAYTSRYNPSAVREVMDSILSQMKIHVHVREALKEHALQLSRLKMSF